MLFSAICSPVRFYTAKTPIGHLTEIRKKRIVMHVT